MTMSAKDRALISSLVPEAHCELKISIPTLHASAKHLVNLGILCELSDKPRYASSLMPDV
jgi:hypothetical protein